MRKFVFRLFLFCLAPLPLLYLLTYAVDSGLKKSHYYYYSEWNDLFSGRINADLLIMGSSRAWVHVSPRIIDSMLHVNSYNLGMDGTAFKYQYERFKIYLKYNRKPKYILQEVGYTSTLVKNNALPFMQQFFPYLNEPSVWYMVTHSDNALGPLDRFFPFYKYNNEGVIVKEGILSLFGKGVKPVKYKGYQGQEKLWDSSFYNFQQLNPGGAVFPIDKEAVALFREFLTFCKTNDIKVVLFYPPAFIQSLDYIKNGNEVLGVYNQLSAEYHIPFYNYVYDSLNYSRSNFYNSLHLNKRGSELFTVELAERLKPEIQPGYRTQRDNTSVK